MLFKTDYRASAHQKLGLDPASWALIASAAVGAGGTAYSARQQRKAGKEQAAAGERAAARAQEQSSTPVDTFKRPKRKAPGFDPMMNAAAAGAGGGLLGS